MSTTIYEYIVDIKSKIDALLARLCSSLGTDMACVFQFDGKDQIITDIWPKISGGNFKIRKLSEFNIPKNLPDIFQELKKLMIFHEPIDKLPQKQSDYLFKFHMPSAVFVPIQNKGELWGCLCCISALKRRVWNSNELSILLNESVDLSGFLFLSEMLSELKEADEQLLMMLNEVAEGIAIVDKELNVKSVSGRVADIGGFVQNELLGRNMWDFIHPDDLIRAKANLKVADLGRRNVDDYRLLLKSGDEIPVRIGAKPLIKKGLHQGYIFYILMLAAPTESELRFLEYQDYLNLVSDLVWATDMNLEFTYFSQSVKHLLDYDVTEAIRLNGGLIYTEKTHQMLAECFASGIKAAKIPGAQYKAIIPVEQYSRKGEIMNGELLLTLRRDHNGRSTGFVGITRFRTSTPFPSII
jgi:PAS domain S-box-containing protein